VPSTEPSSLSVTERVTKESFADAPAPKFFVTLIGAAHIRFGAPWDSVVSHAQADFFDRYLKDQTAALGKLQADATVSGVASIQSTPR
jgi:hypothetical protein